MKLIISYYFINSWNLVLVSLLLSWIQSFLCNRTQSVVVESCHSESFPVMSGVPQGSVLGPCLFLCYIYDLPNSVKRKFWLFADDTIVYVTTDSSANSYKLQLDLAKLEEWEQKCSMEFNPHKCEIIRVSKKKKTVIFPYKLHNIELKKTKNAKYRGVPISDAFCWKKT